jgi:hypothetical protein
MSYLDKEFDHLLQALKLEEQTLRRECDAAPAAEPAAAQAALRALGAAAVVQQVADARARWQALFPASAAPAEPAGAAQAVEGVSAAGKPSETTSAALPRDAYRLPILQALHDLGDRAAKEDVLDRVYRILEHALGPADLEPAPKQKEPRWFARANWCRQDLVLEGLLGTDATSGEWLLTAEGEAVLRDAAGASRDLPSA